MSDKTPKASASQEFLYVAGSPPNTSPPLLSTEQSSFNVNTPLPSKHEASTRSLPQSNIHISSANLSSPTSEMDNINHIVQYSYPPEVNLMSTAQQVYLPPLQHQPPMIGLIPPCYCSTFVSAPNQNFTETGYGGSSSPPLPLTAEALASAVIANKTPFLSLQSYLCHDERCERIPLGLDTASTNEPTSSLFQESSLA